LFISYVQSKWLDFPPYYNSNVFDKWQTHGAVMGTIAPSPSRCSPHKLFHCCHKMHILVQSPAHMSICISTVIQYRNTSRSRPPIRLPSLPLQADCGSIKGAGVPAEENTEHMYSGGEYVTNLIIADVKTLSHDNSNSLQLFFRWSRVWHFGMAKSTMCIVKH